MAKKYYAVRAGRETGIFTSWDECKRLVTGFKGAAFKGFDTLEAARAFMDGTERAAIHNTAADAETDNSGRDGAVTAYVDGSYNINTKKFSYGAVILRDGEEITMSESFDEPENAAMRNVAGEIRGAEHVMRYCAENGIRKLDLYYDYRGIENWCTGEWKATKAGTIAYKEFYDGIKNIVDVKFFKVKGHSGDHYNDMADELAKCALDIPVR